MIPGSIRPILMIEVFTKISYLYVFRQISHNKINLCSLQKIRKAFNNENRRADIVVKTKIKSKHNVISQNLLLDLYYMKVFW